MRKTAKIDKIQYMNGPMDTGSFRKTNSIRKAGNEKKSKRLTIRRLLMYIPLVLFIFAGTFVALIYFTLPDVSGLKTANPASTAFMDYRKAEAAREGKKLVIRQEWVGFERMPDMLKQAVRLSEDAGFYGHDGIDYHELRESIKKDPQQGKKARGGSTITMQLAKNLYLSPRKSYFRKLKEFFIARRLEHSLSKNRIFHLYLNTVELGRGIFGFPAAARFFFSRPVNELGLDEILRLVAVMPKPLRVSPLSSTGYLKWRVRLIAGRLHRVAKVSDGDYLRIMQGFR